MLAEKRPAYSLGSVTAWMNTRIGPEFIKSYPNSTFALRFLLGSINLLIILIDINLTFFG